MPIISPNESKVTEKIRLQVPSDLLREIKSYCKEFSIAEVEDFFNNAAKYVLKTDRDWKRVNNKKSNEKMI